MALLDQEWKDELVALILRELSKTRYACSSLTGLHGGSVNFIFRGILAQPLPGRDGNGDKTAKTVIVKQSTDFLSANANFPIEVSRCVSNSFTLETPCFILPGSLFERVYVVKQIRLLRRDILHIDM